MQKGFETLILFRATSHNKRKEKINPAFMEKGISG